MSTGADKGVSVFNTILLVLLGWLLGLVGQPISEAIKKRCRRAEIHRGMFSELDEVRFRIASVAYLAESRFGVYNRALLEWVLPIFESYKGVNENQEVAKELRKQLTLNETEFAQIAHRLKAEPGRGLGVKKFQIPYVKARIVDLGIFDERTQRIILDICSNVDIFNEGVDEARFYIERTFDSGMSEGNRHRATIGLEESYRNLATRGRVIVEQINQVVPLN